MRLTDLTRRLPESPALREALSTLDAGSAWLSIASEARSLLFAAAYLAHPRKALLVTNTYERALHWQARLGLCGVPHEQMRLLPSGLSVLFEDAAPETVALSDRIGALRFLLEPEPGIVIATAQAALERTMPADLLRESFLAIEPGATLDADRLPRKLSRLGYERADPVRIPGQFAQRGGIVDVFAVGGERPVRIEFFGDEVESLREFDPMSQRSLGALKRIEIAPSRETLLPEKDSGVADLLERTMHLEAAGLPAEAAKRLEESIEADAKSLQARVFFDRLDLYRPLVHPDSGCAVDLLPEGGLLVLDEPWEVEAAGARSEDELGQALQARSDRGEILKSTAHDFMLPPEHLGGHTLTLAITGQDDLPGWVEAETRHALGATSLAGYRGQPTVFTQALKNWLADGYSVVMGTDQPTRSRAVLAGAEIFPTDGEDALSPGLHIVEGNLAGGFVLAESKFALVSDQELFGVGRLKLPQRKFNEGIPIATVLDLTPGDYVVHINFGIGVYRGLAKRVTDGVEKEYLHIEYKAPDRLFVPADQLDRVQKYLAPGEAAPKINRLTGGDWQKTVSRAREEAREFARDLIQLYAKRKAVERPGYGPDTPWQAEMEASFPWVETPSQHEAIEDVKGDLRTDYPMDRLVCGDVGFGKTEVAIRGAFKVAQAGRQVAVLCPTTVLSEQHFRNFSERLGAFPTRLALLNRFCSTAERKAALEGLESGDVDIVIGTHALLNDGLKFKDLGLIVIDEEQKFGVKHKEALKAMRVNVDVLSLSATPIPRTLSMAMMHIRQMSLINDPPPGRLPIRTFVRPYSQEVVREALLRELARGGQVFYVFNRVQGIQHVAERIRKLAPTARVAVGHGQMSESELEPVMIGFIKGEIDVLVSTTIVENGLDIPNANTLIVENADAMGLSQLYQLRGRVGRSDRQAYAYMLYSGAKSLTETGEQRLEALSDFSSLGSGYALAFRDLQIRGAGELLGAKQSGQMAAVGYDLYAQLIEAEVEFLKTFADGERPDGLADPLAGLAPLPAVDLPVVALIPEDYVSDQGQRLYYYKAIMTAREPEALADVAAELRDRYGRLPDPVESALAVMRLRLKAQALQVEKIDGKGGRLAVTFRQNSNHSPRVFRILSDRHREAYLAQDRLIWPFTGDAAAACRLALEALEECIAEVERQRAMLSGGAAHP